MRVNTDVSKAVISAVPKEQSPESQKKNGKVEQKKREGFVKEKGTMVRYQKTPEELQKEQLRKDAENAEKNRHMLEIEDKGEA